MFLAEAAGEAAAAHFALGKTEHLRYDRINLSKRQLEYFALGKI